MDSEIKKPFACTVAGCNQSFTNEDRLSVHEKTHELCLTLTPNSVFKNPFIDSLQTPTPTRFLDPELFQELNPFEATFRNANSLGSGSNSFAIPDSSSLISSLPDSEVLNTPSITLPLNTPSITLPSEPVTPLALRRKASDKDGNKNGVLNRSFDETNDTLPFTPSEKQICDIPLQESESFPTVVNVDYTCRKDISNVIETGIEKQSAIRTSVVQTPVITSVRQSNTALKTNTIGVPTAVVVTRTINDDSMISSTEQTAAALKPAPSQIKIDETNQAIVQSVSVTPMVQLLIRLPDGQTMPVQIPVMPSTSNPVQAVTNIAPQVVQSPSLAKMKLKEVLRVGQKSGIRKKNVLNGKVHSKPHIRVLPTDCLDLSFNISPPLSPGQVSVSDVNGRRRRDSDGDPDEKRKKSLERNRAAATRCRQKRKQWIEALENKADELAHTNVHLQHEVTMLRNEVTQLKTMLLAHKDCPVTLQQKAEFSKIGKESLTTVHILASTSQDMTDEGPPLEAIEIPLNVELMEMEVNSSQSGSSDVSISSDASEVSCKER